MVNNLDWLGELSADRLPARHRQALHGPVHARQGLRPGPAGARAVVHRVQLHAPAGVRLRAPPPDDGRRAADGRRRPVGQHHGRPGADPADEAGGAREDGDPGAGPRPRVQAAAVAVGDEVRQERGRASRSGWTATGRRRTRSTSTGSTPTTATSGRTCAGSPSCRATRSRRSRPRARGAAGGAGGPAGAGARHHGPDARRGRASGRSPIPRRCSRPSRSPIPTVLASLYESAGGFTFAPALARGRASRSCSPRPACSRRAARRAG